MPDTPISPDVLMLDAEGIHIYLKEAWPSRADQHAASLRRLSPGSARLQIDVADRHRRPGGSISGPSMMSLADSGAFLLCLAHLGDAAMAVTSHLSMEFLRRAVGSSLVADVQLEKLGRTQLTFTVRMHTPEMGESRPAAISTVVYSRALLAG